MGIGNKDKIVGIVALMCGSVNIIDHSREGNNPATLSTKKIPRGRLVTESFCE